MDIAKKWIKPISGLAIIRGKLDIVLPNWIMLMLLNFTSLLKRLDTTAKGCSINGQPPTRLLIRLYILCIVTLSVFFANIVLSIVYFPHSQAGINKHAIFIA